eukprot:2604303-Pyramimonas_sp.AAC.1
MSFCYITYACNSSVMIYVRPYACISSVSDLRVLHNRLDLVVQRLRATEGGAQGERGALRVEDFAGGAHVIGVPAVVEVALLWRAQ